MATSWSNPSSWPVAGSVPLMELPARHVVEMAAARTIGGVVRDQQGRPIAGVEVMVEGHVAEVGGIVSIRPRVLTDSDGRWRASGVVDGIDRLSLGFRHPEYAGDYFASRYLMMDQIAPVLAGEHVVVLNKGLVVRGAVLNEQGSPVPGAAVILAPRRYGRFCDEYAWTVTDAAGGFRFDCATDDRTDTTRDGGSTAIIVETPGYGPMMKQITVEPNLAPLEFRLKPGRSLTLRVVGPDDRPIAGAWTAWHPLLEDPRYHASGWQTRTSRGGCGFPNAPETEVQVEILKSGYVYRSGPQSLRRARGARGQDETCSARAGHSRRRPDGRADQGLRRRRRVHDPGTAEHQQSQPFPGWQVRIELRRGRADCGATENLRTGLCADDVRIHLSGRHTRDGVQARPGPVVPGRMPRREGPPVRRTMDLL